MEVHSAEAERALLGTAITSTNGVQSLLLSVPEAAFFYRSHRLAFQAMRELYEQHKPLDAVTIADRLERIVERNDIDPHELVCSLVDASGTCLNAEHYRQIVIDRYQRRSILDLANKAREGAKDDAEIERLVANCMEDMQTIQQLGVTSDSVLVTDGLDGAVDRYLARRPEEVIDTGIVTADRLIRGMEPGEVAVVGAQPSVGKSTLGMGVAAHNAINRRIPSLVVTIEVGTVQWQQKLAIHWAGRHGLRPTRDSLADATVEILRERPPLWVLYRPHLTPSRLRAAIDQLKPKGLRLLVIDYLQLMSSDRRHDSRQAEVSELSRQIKILAGEYGLVVVSLSQLNRQPSSRSNARPRLSDLRESGAIEQDAGVVVLIHRPQYQAEQAPEEQDDVELIIAKNRHGPTGSASVRFSGPRLRFEDRHI